MNVISLAGLPILAIAGFVVYRMIAFKGQSKRFAQQKIDRMKPLEEKFEGGQEPTAGDVLPFAKDVRTREAAYLLLSKHDREDLFPAEYLTLIKGAESNLAHWLEFPTELGACPDELEHIKRVTFDVDGKSTHYEVFKYRVNEPHWAAKDGWMLGVAGPYLDDSKPYDFPYATFSRCDSTLDKVSPDDEAKWVHENIGSRG